MLKEEKTVTQLASENGVHPTQLYKWKNQALEGFPSLFEDDHKAEKAQEASPEHQIVELYAEIGRLTHKSTGSKIYARNGHFRHLSRPKSQQTQYGSQNLSLFAAPFGHQPLKSRLGHRYHLHPFAWRVDAEYLTASNNLHLVAVLDWFSRYVVSWELDQTLEMPFVLKAVDCALAQAVPLIWNSDQGNHFTSPQYVNRLLAADIRISMDGKGRALDNIFTERLWRTVKYEEVYLHDYVNPREARQGLTRYLDFYNFERPHQSLDYQTPAQVYFKDQYVLPLSLLKKEVCSLN